ncbi:MAG: DUF4097 family beta strand repeat protein [Anaerolineae bacterium]|nr:DUF4097 family beta strand repeat protein [Anaerolineae bacterium]
MPDEKGHEKEREKEREKSHTWGKSNTLFWGVFFIGLGVLLLLSMAGAVTFSLGALIGAFFRLWPLWLIAAGLNILFGQTGRFGDLVGAVMGLAVVVIIFGAALTAPGAELQTETVAINRPAGEVRPDVYIDFDDYSGVVQAAGIERLLEANLEHRGDLQVDDNPEAVRIDAAGSASSGDWWNFIDLGLFEGDDDGAGKWEVRLSDTVRLGDLTLKVDDGTHTFDLRNLSISELTLEGDDPNITLSLSELVRDVRIKQDDGEISIQLPDLRDVAVRIDARLDDDGSMSVRTPGLEPARGDSREGTWETENYGDASIERRIYLNIEGGDVRVTID